VHCNNSEVCAENFDLRLPKEFFMKVVALKYFSISLFFLLASCSPNSKTPQNISREKNIAVIGVASDIENINPVFAEEETAGEIGELIFPSLVTAEFDTVRGMLRYYPMLARSWDYADGKSDVIFHLRTDAAWSDGVPVTAKDVQFSYVLYADTLLPSVRQDELDELQKGENGILDVKKSIEVLNDSTVIFHFQRFSPAQFSDAGLPILPKHILDSIPESELRNASFNRNPIGAGPFSVAEWKQSDEVVLASNRSSVLPGPAKLDQLVFRILPDHGSRFEALKSGEIDLMTDLDTREALELTSSRLPIRVVTTPERQYQFVGWNNIDGYEYSKSNGAVIRPNELFGDVRVRRALTMAIDRKSIVTALLSSYGRVAFGPVAPIFRQAYDDALQPLPFDPAAASQLLKQDGWEDKDNEGVLKKGNTKFSFELTIPSDSPFTLDLANIIQQQLRNIKVEAKINQVEESVFWQRLNNKKFDAFIGGFEVPLRIEMSEFWNSDLKKNPFNMVSYRNPQVDLILQKAESETPGDRANGLWKKFQVILSHDQPCTFLFWEKNVIGVSDRIVGTHFSVLGTTDHAWDWSTK
jgi:peptide/nickel transport system substrate-binding protein